MKKNKAWIFILLAMVIVGANYCFDNYKMQEKKMEAAEKAKYNGHEYIDLGLPSGLKWATCNVGASKPEECGDYYSRGGIKPLLSRTSDNAPYGSMCDISGDPRYDVARANWGGNWRIPTQSEIQELMDKCTWIWTVQGNVNGYMVVGPNGNSIFLPAAGEVGESSLNSVGGLGSYWSSTLDESGCHSLIVYGDEANSKYITCGYILLFGDSNRIVVKSMFHYSGYSIRPVAE